MEESADKVLNKAFEIGKKYETQNGACSQCIIAGVFEALNIDNEDVFRAATGLADGVGLTGEGQCGALSGGVMAIGYLFGRKKADFGDKRKILKANILAKKLYNQFIEKYGTCRCYDLQSKNVGRFYDMWDPVEVERAVEDGVLDKCGTVVGEVARMTTKIILEERERESLKQK